MTQLRHYDGPTLTLVVNPNAGLGKAKQHLPKVCETLLTGMPGANLRVYQTTDYAEARLRCIAAVEAARPAVSGVRPDSLLVMGGDGMMHLGINACANTDVPLGVISAGTGNDFAKGIGVPWSNPVAAARAIVAGRTGRMDLLRVTGNLADGADERYVGSIVSTGFDALVNKKTNELRWPRGSLRYVAAVMKVLRYFEPVRYRLVIDGHPRTQQAMFIAVGNAGYFGGGMRPLPKYRIDDGLMDITIVHPVSRATLLRLLPAMFTGEFIKDPAVEMLTARTVEIDGDWSTAMADGEHLGSRPLRAEIVPRALTVYSEAAPALA